MSQFICKCCGKGARWCGDGPVNTDDDDIGVHDCDHIHCDHCGMHYSLESKEASEVETFEELRDLMEKTYNGEKTNE